MADLKFDWSARGWARVHLLTALGTLACILFAFVFDSYSLDTGTWRWGSDPINNLLIPLLLAPPMFFVLLYKMRQLAIAHHELMTIASTDGLTSLLNRRAFTAMVDGYLERLAASPKTSQGALLVLDVDHFKTVNDRFGHGAGDEALKLIAHTVRLNVRESDLVGRMGGEEFAVFAPGLPSAQVPLLAERIRLAVSDAPFTAAGMRFPLTISIGGLTFSGTAKFHDLYRGADDGLYEAKHRGRNRVVMREHGLSPPVAETMH